LLLRFSKPRGNPLKVRIPKFNNKDKDEAKDKVKARVKDVVAVDAAHRPVRPSQLHGGRMAIR
jgi:hypothetical protein